MINLEMKLKRKNESGQAMIIATFMLVAMIGFVGLGIDMGVHRYQKRLQQTAADAGALAGASNLAYGGVITGAQNAATANGFTDNSGGSSCSSVGCISVTVNNGPASGPHSGDKNYVEVIVSVVQPTYFMEVLGVNTATITARAVATTSPGGPNNGCVYTLGAPSSSIEGIAMNGNVTLNAPTCGIVDNGNFNTKGNALNVNAASFGVGGTAGGGGTVTCSDASMCPSTGMPAAGDPLGNLTPPCVGTAQPFNPPCTSGCAGNHGTYTVSPDTYNGMSLNSNSTYNFSSGTYVITGNNFTVPGTTTVNGDGVTFYFTNGATVNITATPAIQLTAPSSGPYQGVVMYQDPSDTTGASLGGNSSSNYNGAVYFPKAQVTFFGNTGYSVGELVADGLGFSGNPTVNVSGSTPGGPIIKYPLLVE
jgi:hypothetical protein